MSLGGNGSQQGRRFGDVRMEWHVSSPARLPRTSKPPLENAWKGRVGVDSLLSFLIEEASYPQLYTWLATHGFRVSVRAMGVDDIVLDHTCRLSREGREVSVVDSSKAGALRRATSQWFQLDSSEVSKK